jgi:hypothetical protein
VKNGILSDGQVPSSCTADDCIGGDGDGKEEIAVYAEKEGESHSDFQEMVLWVKESEACNLCREED